MGGRASRNKGKRGERELAEELARILSTPARRTQQYNGQGDSDVVTSDYPGIHWESKRTEKLKLYDAMDQAVSDKKEGQVPVVCHRKNGREWVLIVRLADLPTLISHLGSPTPSS